MFKNKRKVQIVHVIDLKNDNEVIIILYFILI